MKNLKEIMDRGKSLNESLNEALEGDFKTKQEMIDYLKTALDKIGLLGEIKVMIDGAYPNKINVMYHYNGGEPLNQGNKTYSYWALIFSPNSYPDRHEQFDGKPVKFKMDWKGKKQSGGYKTITRAPSLRAGKTFKEASDKMIAWFKKNKTMLNTVNKDDII